MCPKPGSTTLRKTASQGSLVIVRSLSKSSVLCLFVNLNALHDEYTGRNIELDKLRIMIGIKIAQVESKDMIQNMWIRLPTKSKIAPKP